MSKQQAAPAKSKTTTRRRIKTIPNETALCLFPTAGGTVIVYIYSPKSAQNIVAHLGPRYILLFPFSGFGKKLSVGGWPNKSYQVFKAVFCARNGLFGES